MSKNVQKALELFNGGFNCSQSIIGTFCGQFGMNEELALKLTCGFAGGLRCGEVCGAVSSAAMIIGLRYGQYVVNDKASKEKCYKITSDFMEEYQKRKGSVLCRELLGYDVRDTERRTLFPGRQREVCPKVIETAVLLLEEMVF
jgi:C_GCAxxG_C_C family probable redox protein